MFSTRDPNRSFVPNLLIDSDDEAFNSGTDDTTANLMFKDNDSDLDDKNSINYIILDNIDQIINGNKNEGEEDIISYNILQSNKYSSEIY